MGFFRNLFSKRGNGFKKAVAPIKNVDLEFLQTIDRLYPDMTPEAKKQMITIAVDLLKHPNTVPDDLEAIATKAEGKIGSLTRKAKSGSKKIARYENLVNILKLAENTYKQGIKDQQAKVQKSKDLAAEYGLD